LKKVSIISEVDKGRLKRNRKRIEEAVKSFEGKEIKLTIERNFKKRSNNQNAYYWGVVVPLFRDGLQDSYGEKFSLENAHEEIKRRFNLREVVNIHTGEITHVAKSTTENSTIEMEEYMSEVRAFMLEYFGITCPLPNEQIEIF
jgi:hypothetical protein